MTIRAHVFFGAALLALVLSGELVLSQSPPSKPFGMARRVNWTTSKVVGSPEPPRKYRLTRAFSQVSFKEPVYIAQDPTSERFMVAEYTPGLIYSFRPDDPSGKKDLFLDMKRGISAFSFHPKYAENGYVFVFSHLDPKVKGPQLSRVSRFQLAAGSNPPRLRPESQKIIVEWPARGHNGGEAVIGPDGYLYITTGDGTSGSDPNGTGQSMNDLLAAMMRLDVDHPDAGRNYSIPKDNPFVDLPGARPEVWAYGFRNPWRFSFDPHTGQPWVGDVGQDLWEMIELSSRGANHGWSVMEGSSPFHPNSKRGPTPFVAPVVEHHHTEARSITGGYVYQGAKFPELRDVYLYGDYQYGKMWGLRYDHDAKKVTWHEEVADTTVKMAGFGVGRDGSFYAVDYDRGQIFQLERQPPALPLPPFPRKLSETGIFASVARHEVAAGVIPYSINAPFWSDGAVKERFLAMPEGRQIKFNETKPWEFDDGAVTVKSFSLEMEEGNPASRKRIETRIVVKQDDRWVGYTYNWNDEQTDATLVEAKGMDRSFSVKERSGGVREQVWHYPSRNECMFCHSRAAGFVLGLTTPQMNRSHKYEAAEDNQLRTFSHIGLFKTALPKAPSEYLAYRNPFDETAPLATRVKTYLQVNCAMCHVSDGGGNSLIELGYKTPLAKAHMVNEPPMHDTFGINNARLVAPGDPMRSVLFHRVNVRGNGQMPPTSTNRVDEAGAKLLRDWIRELPGGTEAAK
ncbi:MAG TPA: PQQ-dependent sugar dehydrogenase [Bryobacteraceae bacterium]|nr:PQQ-dependent sugar dehydrogenase [Bryobacteraceae bacterium]